MGSAQAHSSTTCDPLLLRQPPAREPRQWKPGGADRTGRVVLGGVPHRRESTAVPASVGDTSEQSPVAAIGGCTMRRWSVLRDFAGGGVQRGEQVRSPVAGDIGLIYTSCRRRWFGGDKKTALRQPEPPVGAWLGGVPRTTAKTYLDVRAVMPSISPVSVRLGL
jgi:hypothetical protein